MTLSPELLLTVATERLRVARPDLADHSVRAAKDMLKDSVKDSVKEEARAEGVAAIAVVRDVRLPSWVRETCAFALALTPERSDAWRRSLTRTLYLAGRPDNLRERFAFTHVAADGTAAWAGPDPDRTTTGLRRLLRTFRGHRLLTAWHPETVELPCPQGDMEREPVHRDLYLATAHLTLADALVHLGHLLAESVIDGTLGPGDRLTLRSVPHLTTLATPYAALRVDTDRLRPDRLRAYAALTQET
jgi:hypothetical protein